MTNREYKTETYVKSKPEDADRATVGSVVFTDDGSHIEPTWWSDPECKFYESTSRLTAYGATFEKLIKAPEGFYIGDPVEDAGYQGEYRFHDGCATVGWAGAPTWVPSYIYFLLLPKEPAKEEPALPPYDETKYKLATDEDKKGRKPNGCFYWSNACQSWESAWNDGTWCSSDTYLIPLPLTQPSPIPCAGYVLEDCGALRIVQEAGTFQREGGK
jgi:hypothetical protein